MSISSHVLLIFPRVQALLKRQTLLLKQVSCRASGLCMSTSLDPANFVQWASCESAQPSRMSMMAWLENQRRQTKACIVLPFNGPTNETHRKIYLNILLLLFLSGLCKKKLGKCKAKTGNNMYWCCNLGAYTVIYIWIQWELHITAPRQLCKQHNMNAVLELGFAFPCGIWKGVSFPGKISQQAFSLKH